MTHPLIVVDHRVLGARVDFNGETPHELVWEIEYAEKDEEEDFRYVTGWLHGASEFITFHVNIGSMVEETGVPYHEDDIEMLLANSAVAETLFYKARSTARSLMALMNEDVEIPESLEPTKIALIPEPDDESDAE